MFSGMNSRLKNGAFINSLYKRGDNYAYSPVSELTASDYFNKLFKLYPQNSRYYKRNPTSSSSSSSESDSTKNSKSVSASVKDEKQEVSKKSDDTASPASL